MEALGTKSITYKYMSPEDIALISGTATPSVNVLKERAIG
jgi:hypothetical protein